MKIKKLIELIEIEKDFDIKFIPLGPGQSRKNVLTIYATENGIAYWEDADVSFLSIDESCERMVYDITQYLVKNIRGLDENTRERDKYLAISEILIAIDLIKGGKGEIDLDQAKNYVNRLNQKVSNLLDFSEISNMKDLIDTILKDKLYRELCFSVTEIMCNKKDRYRGYNNQEKKYIFGNKMYHENLDVVVITLYNDCVEVLHQIEGNQRSKTLDMRREHSTEEKIFSALDCWKSAFWN